MAKAKQMTYQEVADLTEGDPFYIFRDGVLIPVYLKAGIPEDSREVFREISRKEGPKFRHVPSVTVQSIYGTIYFVSPSEIYHLHPGGEEVPVVETVGAQVSLVLYAPGMDGTDVLSRIREALRKEFGTGLLLRQKTSQPVSNQGLPPILGVSDGGLPKPL